MNISVNTFADCGHSEKINMPILTSLAFIILCNYNKKYIKFCYGISEISHMDF